MLLVLGIIAAVVFTSNGNPSGASSSSTMGGGGAFSDVIIKTTAIAEVNSAASSTAHQAATSVTRTYDGRSTTNTSTSSVGSTATQHAPTLTINDASAQPTNKTTSSSSGSDGYWSKTYSGVGTHCALCLRPPLPALTKLALRSSWGDECAVLRRRLSECRLRPLCGTVSLTL